MPTALLTGAVGSATMVPMTNPLKYFNSFYDSLKRAQEDRHCLPWPEWHTYEMLTMMRNVNRVRYHKDEPLVSLEEIEAVEQQAAGHVDYTKKFALYCAELAVGNEPEYY